MHLPKVKKGKDLPKKAKEPGREIGTHHKGKVSNLAKDHLKSQKLNKLPFMRRETGRPFVATGFIILRVVHVLRAPSSTMRRSLAKIRRS